MKTQVTFATYLALAAAVLFWGLSFVATKMALESIPPFTLVFARFGIASIFFMLFMLRRGFPSFSRRDHFKMFFLAIFEPGLYFIFETTGLQYTSAPKAALIIATIPVTVTVMAALFLRERTSPLRLMGIVLSLIGIVILVLGDPLASLNLKGSLLGDLLILGAVFSAAMYIICARNLGQYHSAFEITTLQIIYGSFFYAPAFLWEVPTIQWAAISGRSIAALVYLTLFATITAFLCYNFALTRIAASRAAVFINGIPVVTAAGAWVLLGETLTGFQVAGGGLVLAAVFLTNMPIIKKRSV